ncbi:MAG TPA: DNA polymerase III subunit delta', partial [Xanthobacteraceae bacterium]|nr:DNA polymerase III subunit delta' [Xanthobacteraceae bacterium]
MSELASHTATWQPLPSWQTAIASSALAHRQRWPHALLITGRRGLGKRLLALHFARALLCEAPQESGEACGVCPSCGYVAQGTHPDLQLIEPVTYDEEGNRTPTDAINVERVRELIEFSQLSPHRQRAKVGLIAPAEAMNAAAANALLKTLEEPPAGTFLLLVSHQPARLPPTIVSRCRRLPAPEPDRAAAAAWLAQNGIGSADPNLVLAQAGGAPLFALVLAAADIQRERDHLLLQLAQPERLSPLAFGARLGTAPKDERKTQLANAVYWLLAWTADLASVAAGAAPSFNPDQGEALARLAGRVARVPLFRYYQELLKQRALISHPLQPRWVAEA